MTTITQLSMNLPPHDPDPPEGGTQRAQCVPIPGRGALQVVCMLQGGQLVVYGCLSGKPPTWPWQSWVFRGLSVSHSPSHITLLSSFTLSMPAAIRSRRIGHHWFIPLSVSAVNGLQVQGFNLKAWMAKNVAKVPSMMSALGSLIKADQLRIATTE